MKIKMRAAILIGNYPGISDDNQIRACKKIIKEYGWVRISGCWTDIKACLRNVDVVVMISYAILGDVETGLGVFKLLAKSYPDVQIYSIMEYTGTSEGKYFSGREMSTDERSVISMKLLMAEHTMNTIPTYTEIAENHLEF